MSKYNPKYLDNEEKELLNPIESLDIEKIKPPSEKDQSEFRNETNCPIPPAAPKVFFVNSPAPTYLSKYISCHNLFWFLASNG